MGAPKFQYKKPLVVKLGTGVSGNRNGTDLTTREFFGKNDQNVTLLIGQEVATASNVQFNNITSLTGIKLGDDSLFLGDGFISGSNSVVAHTGSIVVTSNVTAPSMTTNRQLNYEKFEVSVTGSTTIFESGSVGYFEYLNIPNRLGYLRKSFVHTGSFESAKTSSFTAVTASAPTGLTATSEEDFMFFINGMLIENDALTINQKTSTNLELRLDTSGLGYELESDDEVIGFGKFNS